MYLGAFALISAHLELVVLMVINWNMLKGR